MSRFHHILEELAVDYFEYAVFAPAACKHVLS